MHLEETRPRGGARFAILHIESERSVLHIDGFAYAVAGRSQSGPDREGEVTPQQSPAEFLDRFGREINRPVRAIVGGEIRLEPDTFLLKFPLPIDVQPPVPGFQFNELRGAHLAKTEAGQVAPQHEVILDLSWTSALSLSMTVNVEVQVASTILRESLGHVLRVAGYVVERRSSQAAPNSRREQP